MGTITKTVLFTDLADYTAEVARSDRESIRRLLKAHEEVVESVVHRYGGVVKKCLGDSFLVLFSSATDAVRAALEVQDVVAGMEDTRIRVSLTTGDVEEIDGDAFGDCVNLAARILGKTPAGQVWFGLGTRVCMNESEIPWENVGSFGFKGVTGEQDVFRAVSKGVLWLPDPVSQALEDKKLVRLKRGERPPSLAPDAVVLFEGFQPGSDPLQKVLDKLPVLDPAQLWLSTYNIASLDRKQWEDAGRGLVIGTPEALEEAIQVKPKEVAPGHGSSDTMILDLSKVNLGMELTLCGLALPRVPLSDIVDGYSFDLVEGGQFVHASDHSLLRISVSHTGAQVTGLTAGTLVNGRNLGTGQSQELKDGVVLEVGGRQYRYQNVDRVYVGLLMHEGHSSLSMPNGLVVQVGREPGHPGLAIPDRPGQDNLRWCVGTQAARARQGGFTLDRALTGRQQATVVWDGMAISLTPLHARCPTYILSSETQTIARAKTETQMDIDDLLIMGTSVVSIVAPE